MFEQYKGVGSTLREYWRAYGGWTGLFSSPYLHLAVLLTLAQYSTWTHANWWADVKAVLPNLVGFTLSAYALLVSVGNDDFRALIMGSGPGSEQESDKPSPFVGLSAGFAHFIFVQVVALLFAVVASNLHPAAPWVIGLVGTAGRYVGLGLWFVGYFLFVYALVLSFAAVLSVFWISLKFDKFQRSREKTERAIRLKRAQSQPGAPGKTDQAPSAH